jgi:chromosomal replication initiation ATPase DnaA
MSEQQLITLPVQEVEALIDAGYHHGMKRNQTGLRNLKNLYKTKITPASPEHLRDIVLAEFKLTQEAFEAQDRHEHLVRARYVLARLLQKHFKLRAPSMRKLFNRTHASVHKKLQHFQGRYLTDDKLREHYHNIIEKLELDEDTV